MVTLYPEQQQIKDEVRTLFTQRYHRPLVVAPTGFGKGVLAGSIILDAAAKGNRVIFVVNRRELVKDMSRRLTRLGINHGILMGEKTRGSHLEVLIASQDTLRNRINKIAKPDLVFIDEAHLFVSKKSKELIDKLTEAGSRVILMTATPWRLDRKGMGEIADYMIQGPSVASLIEQGRLAVPVVYAPATPDMSHVHTTSSGEYDEDETAQVMGQKTLIGDLVTHWKTLAYGRKTVGFAVNRKLAEEYSAAFRDAGITSVAVDALTPDKERDRIWSELASGSIQVVWSVGIISYGWDVPQVDCLLLARPTMSLALHLQQCGRGLRAHPGKVDCLILDHAGNTIRHGLPEDPRKWSLRGRTKKADDEALKIAKLPQVCPKCTKVVKSGTAVCQCGYVFSHGGRPAARQIKIEQGELVRVESRIRFNYPETTGDVGRDSLIGVAAAKGYNPGWIKHREKALDVARREYRDTFGQDAKEHWTSGQIRGIIAQQAKQPSLPSA